jgi:hypothetical protein
MTTAATDTVRFDLRFHTVEQLVELATASASFMVRTGDDWGFTVAQATFASVGDELAKRAGR